MKNLASTIILVLTTQFTCGQNHLCEKKDSTAQSDTTVLQTTLKSTKKLNPLKSLSVTLWHGMEFKNHFYNDYNGKTIKMQDSSEFEIFRHVVIGNRTKLRDEKGAIFLVQFKLSHMSVKKNKRFSRLPIPMFIGLPGFRAKFWMCNEKTGYNQGIYQWKTEQDAINYSQSFPYAFMSKRSLPNSISYQIIPNENIYSFIEKKLQEAPSTHTPKLARQK